jgi:Membrane protein involved in the export of O-antigen and teichoic acid
LAGDPSPESQGSEDFSDRVFVFFLTQILTAGLGLFNGFFLARLIGPSGKGDYYLLTFLPTTLMVVCQLGLPQAFTFFSARRLTRGLVAQAIVLSALVSFPVLLAMLALLPALQATILQRLDASAIVVALVSLPLLLNANFTTGIVVGRQAAVGMAVVYISAYLSATALILLLAGVLGLGVWGGLIAFVMTAAITAGGFLTLAIRVIRKVPAAGPVAYRALLRYGLPFYPGSLSQFFAARADIYMLALLLAEPSAPLGYYSMAVAMAELVYLFPNAVSTFFFPRVAAASREESDRQVAMVSRVTLLLTGAVALALVPVSAIAIELFLPAFEPSLPALYVLLPGVVAIAVTQVLTGYVAGLGRPGLASLVSIFAFGANVVFNLLLIPRFGIVGASAASLMSYTLSSIVYSVVAARLTAQRASDFWVPRRGDARFAADTAVSLIRRIARVDRAA